MSQGRFAVGAKYQASADNGGGIYSIRVQPETLAFAIGTVTNASPTAAKDQRFSAQVSGSIRRYGLHAVKAYLSWTGTVPDNYDPRGIIAIPLLTSAIRAVAVKDAAGTYLGQAVRVVGTTPEILRA
jgi:hypothetical protein